MALQCPQYCGGVPGHEGVVPELEAPAPAPLTTPAPVESECTNEESNKFCKNNEGSCKNKKVKKMCKKTCDSCDRRLDEA